MELHWLYARNFRKLKGITLEFSSQVNEIVGKNAQGKTSLLEAIHLCMTGNSFRTSSVRELVAHETDGFFVECGFQKQGIGYELQMSFDGVKRRISLNRRPCESITLLLGQIIGVTCTPEMQSLVKGSPHLRRHFLDLQLAQIDPLYVHHLSRYTRALKQRNVLLRAGDLRTIGIWEEKLALSAAYITRERSKLIDQLNGIVRELYTELSSRCESNLLHLVYETKGGVEVVQEDLQMSVEYLRLHFEKELCRRRVQEASYGATLVGPHRDDIKIFLGGKLASEFASEGEMRLCALTLKFAEWRLLKAVTNETPIMLIDDCSVYLDGERSQKLFGLMSSLGQVFLSSLSSFQGLGLGFTNSLKTFALEDGLVNQKT